MKEKIVIPDDQDPQADFEQQLDIPQDTIDGIAKEGGVIGNKRNMYCSGHKVSSPLYRQHYEEMNWRRD